MVQAPSPNSTQTTPIPRARSQPGQARAIKTKRPAARKNSASSAWDQAVTTAKTAKIPEQRIALIGRACQLVGRDGDDGDDRCTDAVEEGLHPPQTTEGDVRHREADDHQERREHEGQAHQGGTGDPRLEVADGNGGLGRQGTRHDLGKPERQLIGVLIDPATPLDQVPVHIPHQRSRPAKADSTELQEVARDRPQASPRF